MKLTAAAMITFTFFTHRAMAPPQTLHHAPRGGFPPGATAITRQGAQRLDSWMDFGVVQLAARESLAEFDAKETAWVLLRGEAEVTVAGQTTTIRRESLFDEAPTALHVGPATPVAITGRTGGAQFAV